MLNKLIYNFIKRRVKIYKKRKKERKKLKNLKVQDFLKYLLHKISSNRIEIKVINNRNKVIYINSSIFLHIDSFK
jgi:hypothetical protein